LSVPFHQYPIFCFTLSALFHECSILIFISVTLLPEGQSTEVLKPSKEAKLFKISHFFKLQTDKPKILFAGKVKMQGNQP
jgi:hypothetical protein